MTAKQSFVLVNTANGPMIVNRLDIKILDNNQAIGVGMMLLETGEYEAGEIEFTKRLLSNRRAVHGDGVHVIDGGANIGVMTIAWAKHMHGWGRVDAVEPQSVMFYTLCGNVVLNNVHNNVTCHNIALGAKELFMNIPLPDYDRPGCFGGLNLRDEADLGQPRRKNTEEVSVVRIDDMAKPLKRLDLIKLDLEGMELEALDGAEQTLIRLRPMVLVEHILMNNDERALMLEIMENAGYKHSQVGMNTLFVHKTDESVKL